MTAEPPPSVRAVLFAQAAAHIALAVVGRDCRFAGLAICVVTVAQINRPAQALATGGILNIVMGAVLLALAWKAPQRTFKRSDVWRSIHEDLRVAPEEALSVLRIVLRATYLRLAGIAARAAAWFLAMAGLIAAYSAWAG